MERVDEETVRERQRRVTLSGGRWEEYVRLYLNEKLKGLNVEVIVGKYEQRVRQRSVNLWKTLCIPIKSTTKEYVWVISI
ncbi:MAG: hypothetical protein QXV37_00130 [Candidatus Jordarchaeaceae archaeon]